MGARRIRPVPALDGSTLRHAGGNLFVDSVTGMVLSRVGNIGTLGYERVAVNGVDVAAHRVVWEAVHGPIPNGLTVNHKDGRKTNNRPDNLELATQSEQNRHAYAIGLRVGNGLTGKPRPSRLTPEQIVALLAAPHGKVTELCRELGISRSYGYQVRGRRRLATPR